MNFNYISANQEKERLKWILKKNNKYIYHIGFEIETEYEDTIKKDFWCSSDDELTHEDIAKYVNNVFESELERNDFNIYRLKELYLLEAFINDNDSESVHA